MRDNQGKNMSKIPILKAGKRIDFHQLFDVGIYGLPSDATFINGPDNFKSNGVILIENLFDSEQNKIVIHTLFTDYAGLFVEVYNSSDQSWSDWAASSVSGGGAIQQLWECTDGSVTANTEYNPKTRTFTTKISASGAKGDKGDKGDPGTDGQKGDTGERGEQGIPGKDGAQGAKGDKGEAGPQGERGEQGIPGKDGAQGVKGEKGDVGAQGERGLTGAKGDKGDTGPPGKDGRDGNDETCLPVYEFNYGKGIIVEYDKTLIPAVTTIDIKKPFPSKEIIISVPAILDSNYDTFKYMVFAVNLGTTTVKIDGTDNEIAHDMLVYVRVSVEVAKLPTALYVSTEYIAFKIDVTKLFNNPAAWNCNQKLIKITASSYNEKGYLALPAVIDDSNPSRTSWHRTNKLGTNSLITLASQMYFNYDGRQVNSGNGTVEFIVDMQRNRFSNNFIKYLVFYGETTTVIPTHKLKLIIKANSDAKIVTDKPYTILNKNEYTFEFLISNAADNIRNYVAVTMVCQNSNILLTAFQF